MNDDVKVYANDVELEGVTSVALTLGIELQEWQRQMIACHPAVAAGRCDPGALAVELARYDAEFDRHAQLAGHSFATMQVIIDEIDWANFAMFTRRTETQTRTAMHTAYDRRRRARGRRRRTS